MAKGPAVVLCVVATTIVLIPFRAFTQQAQTPAEWKPLEAALGRSGKVQPDGAFKFGMPRKDLKVTVGDVQIKPGFALGAWAAFSSSGDDAMVMGDMVLTEDEVPPVIAKLQQEKILSEYCRHNPNVAVLMASYSTLYGPEQASGKAQGLLTHISRQVVRGLPVRIYVPLDTIRDYLEVDDAARGMLAASESVSLGSAVTKIVASERPTTISEIIALFRKVSWRPPKIITSMTRSSSLYAKRIQFKSWLRPDLRAVYRTSLVVGISAVLDAERMRYAHDG